MTPEMNTMDQEPAEETRMQEQFVAQVEDHSLPAQEILTDQQAGREESEAPVLYVP